MDASILLPTYNEEKNIGQLISEIKCIMNELNVSHEIIVMDGQSTDKTLNNAKKAGAKVFTRSSSNYRTFMPEGFEKTRGKFIITLDADFSHPPTYIKNLWEARDEADMIICSRWVEGGGAAMSLFRKRLSHLFNFVYRVFLSIGTRDLNCNYRLYHRRVLENMKLVGDGMSITPEIAFHATRAGYKIKEIPFFYDKRSHGKSKLKLLSYGKMYLTTLFKLWKIKHLKSKLS